MTKFWRIVKEKKWLDVIQSFGRIGKEKKWLVVVLSLWVFEKGKKWLVVALSFGRLKEKIECGSKFWKIGKKKIRCDSMFWRIGKEKKMIGCRSKFVNFRKGKKWLVVALSCGRLTKKIGCVFKFWRKK